jgi:uncharacterized protein
VIKRAIEAQFQEALEHSPVVLLLGARQVGKSTLAQKLAKDKSLPYITFDEATSLSAASLDAQGYIQGLQPPLVLDEVQRVPEVFLPIKLDVDSHRQTGRYVLTGSANVLSLPRLADSLAGRMQLIRLYPLSQQEIEGHQANFIDSAFQANFGSSQRPTDLPDLINRILSGGYPEALDKTPRWRKKWFESYLSTIMQRDIRDLSHIEGLRDMPRLFNVLAARSSTLLNTTALSRDVGLAASTLKRYLSLLEAIFLLQFVPAWTSNISKRTIKSPKILLADTGLVCSLLGLDASYLQSNHTLLGQLLESFVTLELLKQASWSEAEPGLYHYRSQRQSEVDIVLEGPAGRILGIEVKLSQSIDAQAFRGLAELQAELGERFHRGIVLYSGAQVVPFGKKLLAVPLHRLWS